MTSAQPLSASADRVSQLQTFVRIVEAGSLSAAAAQLGTTQPTVSRRLAALESALGVLLLRRSTHTMKLTEDGARCLERARDLLAGLESFDAELRGGSMEPRGTLRVVVPHAFGQELLVAPLAAFLRRAPEVSVEWILHDGQPNFIADGIDCAIHVGPITDPSVVTVRLSEIPRIVVASPSLVRPAARRKLALPRDLGALPWLALSTFYRTAITLQHARSGELATLPIRPRMSTDSLYALRSAAVLGVGVCVGSAWLLADDLAAGKLVQLLPDWCAAPLPVHLVYPQASFYPARLRNFLDEVRASVPGIVAATTAPPVGRR